MHESAQQSVKTTRFGKRQVLFDAALVESPDEALFVPSAEDQIAMSGESVGRAQVVAHRYRGIDVVSKHYFRGGLMAHLFEDVYFGSRAENSRAFREWCMLSIMRQQGLPVPVPVAASVISSGLMYRCDLVTRLIPNVHTLAELCKHGSLGETVWKRVGEIIRRFHDNNVCHADLNARNVLIDDSGEVLLIDFDKGRFRQDNSRWREMNLSRLLRSLNKFVTNEQSFSFNDDDWQALMSGYNG